MSAIYLKHGDDLAEMVEAPYEAEELLQKLIADYPNLLAGDEEGERHKRWLLVQRELGVASEEDGTNRWSLDHLFLDAEGVPTLVEVKRSSDTRIRREVVGQMLDYAANGSLFWGLETIRSSFDAAREAEGQDPDQALATFLGEEDDPAQFWERVGTNLQAGRLRLVFVADEIPSELRRVIEFLNEQMTRTEVVGLEVKQYVERDGARQTLVPRLIGQTEAARHTKGTAPRRRRKWDEESVLAGIREAQPAELAGRQIRLYEWMRDAGAHASWGSGEFAQGTMCLGEPDHAVCVGFYAGGIWINFSALRRKRAPAEMERLADLLRRVPGVAPYVEAAEEKQWGKHTSMDSAEVLASDDALEAWKRALAEASTSVG